MFFVNDFFTHFLSASNNLVLSSVIFVVKRTRLKIYERGWGGLCILARRTGEAPPARTVIYVVLRQDAVTTMCVPLPTFYDRSRLPCGSGCDQSG